MRRQIEEDVPNAVVPSTRAICKVIPDPLTISLVERILPNGDLYIGGFAHRSPHGSGKYLWKDGCMYEGDWRRGKAAGKGKFSWPSGATFEGEFRGGRMEGFGIFTGPEGDTYNGTWSADRKHGHGSKAYANGDFYQGTWRRNVQDGHGRYIWRNGNQYVGEWRNGVISGRGVLIWGNGNRYDGHWENGVPKGNGVFTWPDGSCYIGNWSKNQLTGTFYPPVAPKRSSSTPSREKNFPRICIWESDGEAGDITCDIIDNLEAAMMYRDGKMGRGECCFNISAEAKKPGHTISKGHKNYELMCNLQLGITYSVGKAKAGETRELRNEDFDPREKFWTRFPPQGSKTTPPHQSAEFWWKDYCPVVFRHLRKLFSVDPADYMMAICGNDALRELSSPGKSGSFFYLTQDDRFMIKTVKKSEVKVLIRMLTSYYRHMFQYENSLVTKFFGVHCVKPVGGLKVRFIVMGNLFFSEHRIHRRFDLKGSSYGRTTDKPEGEIDETTTLKDLDLNFVFRLQRSSFLELLRQVDQDCEFLEREGIMDYSLLVGLHFRDDISASDMGVSPFSTPSKRDSLHGGSLNSEYCFAEPEWKDIDHILDARKPLSRLGSNMPARAEHLSRNSNFELYPLIGYGAGGGLWIPSNTGKTHDVVLYFGIIDILQDYDISKKIEHAYKSLQVDPSSISAVDPKLYSRRFRDFIRRVFAEDNDR